MASKYWKTNGKNGGGSSSDRWQHRQRMCAVCGRNAAIIGGMCQSCSDFIKSQKGAERGKK